MLFSFIDYDEFINKYYINRGDLSFQKRDMGTCKDYYSCKCVSCRSSSIHRLHLWIQTTYNNSKRTALMYV